MYQVNDCRTGERATRREYRSLVTARNAAERMNLVYGAHRYYAVRVQA